MTLKIEKDSDGQQTTIRLIGHMQAEHLEELKAQMKGSGPGVVLDLEEVTLVDVRSCASSESVKQKAAKSSIARPTYGNGYSVSKTETGEVPIIINVEADTEMRRIPMPYITI